MSKEDVAPIQVPVYIPAWNPQPPQYVQVPQQINEKRSYHLPGMKRPFGTFYDFIVGMFFGTVAPFFSQLTTHAFETSRLTRIGTFFGSANVLLIGAWMIMSLGLQVAVQPMVVDSDAMMMDLRDANETDYPEDLAYLHQNETVPNYPAMWTLFGMALFVFVLAFAFLSYAGKSFNLFLNDYHQADLESHEAVTVTSEIGTRSDFIISAILTIFFPLIAGFLRLRFKPTLKSKYGIMKGFGLHMLLWAVFHPCFIIPALIFVQIADVHFRRALVCAGEAPQTCGRWRRNQDVVAINA
eukprot:TRINITY_DN21395_c0_g1_i1.p1 TRINITY_DN21395_c0_g1~~TRINITY_DN21395_c0_g1_i1.p1  ORF type:complete len:297 (+),score=89.95 TRINITY_DN21395_c0_g1_i1:37-927(+)